MIEVVVARKTAEAQGVCAFELVPAGGGALPAFTAGAHVDVQLRQGLVRPYSLCDLRTDRYLVAVQRGSTAGGASWALHDEVRAGDRLQVSAPRNLFGVREDAPHHVLVAGGIGITPLLCIAGHLQERGGSFELHYCVRARERAAFLGRLGRHTLHLSPPGGANPFDARRTLAGVPAGAHVYVCGPARLIDGVEAAAAGLGWTPDRVHRERFGAAAPAGARAFTLRIASTGAHIAVAPQQRMIDALREAGIDVPSACEQGFCGSCLTGVLDGIPLHADVCQTAAEQAANTRVAPCCSRALSELLTLDL